MPRKTVIKKALSVFALVLFASCGGSSTIDERSFSSEIEVTDMDASPSLLFVGEFTRVSIDFTTFVHALGDYSDVDILVRYSDQLSFIEGTSSVEVSGAFLESDENRLLSPHCIGDSPERGDRYVGFRIDREVFEDADNDQGRLTLSLQAQSAIEEAFILADAEFLIVSVNCANDPLDPQAATSVQIQ